MYRWLKKFWKDIIALLVFVGVTVFLFGSYIINDTFPYASDFSASDLTELNIPLRVEAAAQWREGHVPLWTDRLSSGFPLLAEGQAGIFYAPGIMPYIWFAPGVATVVVLWIHVLLALIFSYGYARLMGLSPGGSVMVALAFSLSGFFMFRMKHLNMVQAAVWLPLQFFLLEQLVRTKRWGYGVGFSIVTAVQFFAGHPQVSYICGLSSVMYYFFHTYQPWKNVFTYVIKVFLPTWGLIAVLTFGLVAVQFLPTYELSFGSIRNEMISLATTLIEPPIPMHLFTALYPYALGNPAIGTYDSYFYGNFWENNFFLGGIALFFVILACIGLQRKKILYPHLKVVWMMMAGSAFFIFSTSTIVLFVVAWYLIPGLSLFRYPQRWILVWNLMLSILAGVGFSWISQKWRVQGRGGRLVKAVVIGGIVFGCMFVVDWHVRRQYIVAMPQRYFTAPETVQWLHADEASYRVMSLEWREGLFSGQDKRTAWLPVTPASLAYPMIVPPNLNMLYGIDSVDDKALFEGGNVASRLFHLLISFRSQLAHAGALTEVPESMIKILSLQNVKYLITRHELSGQGLIKRQEFQNKVTGTVFIYELQTVLPRAYMVYHPIVLLNEFERIDFMLSSLYDPQRDIVLETVDPSIDSVAGVTGDVTIDRYSTTQKVFKVSSSNAGWLSISQTWYPGWQASLDGRRVALLHANQAFMAVAVPAGTHEVVLTYQPWSYYIGRWISLFTWLTLGGWGIVVFVRTLMRRRTRVI